MKINAMSAAAVAFAAFASWVYLKPKVTGAPPQTGGEVQRMAGVTQWYGTSEKQQTVTQSAITQSWADLNKTVFASQPDFWV